MPRSSLAIMFAALTLAACPKPEDKETSDDGAGDTDSGATPPPERPEAMPMLCSIDAGKWCTGCPQGNAGPLCCADATCVEGSICEGVVGWCNNYTLADDPKVDGMDLKLATCHDE